MLRYDQQSPEVKKNTSSPASKFSEIVMGGKQPINTTITSSSEVSQKFTATQTLRTISKKSFGSVLRKVNRTKAAAAAAKPSSDNAEITFVGKGLQPDELPGQGRRYNGLGIFDRPGFGSVAFRKSLPANSFSEAEDEYDSSNAGSYGKPESIGSAGSLALRSASSSGRGSAAATAAAAAEANCCLHPPAAAAANKYKAVVVFLTSLGLEEWISLFEDERIDACALYLIEEDDLIQMGIPTGPRKKILKALSERRHDMDHPSAITDSKL